MSGKHETRRTEELSYRFVAQARFPNAAADGSSHSARRAAGSRTRSCAISKQTHVEHVESQSHVLRTVLQDHGSCYYG